MKQIEERIGYSFKDLSLLERALTHSSYANEERGKGVQSNERLEFLGDSVLGMMVAEYLYLTEEKMPEGGLTRRRAALVCESSLAEAAREIGLGAFLLLGKGEENGGRNRSSTLADAMEAIIAAVYLDGGIEAARNVVMSCVVNRMKDEMVFMDYKTELQEILQKDKNVEICYRLVGEEGPDHAKIFRSEVLLNGKVMGEGSGRSKKEAEQMAAKAALALINKGND